MEKERFLWEIPGLYVGFLISVIVLITLSSQCENNQALKNTPVLVFSTLSFPYVDTLRVMFIRKKYKNFEPDKTTFTTNW